MSDESRRDLDTAIRLALSRTRAGDLAFPAHFSGLRYDEVGDGACRLHLSAQPQVLDASGAFANMPVAMACDISLSSAIRSTVKSTVGKEIRLPTVSLELEFLRAPIRAEALMLHSRFGHRIGNLATAETEVRTAAGECLIRARGRFVVTGSPPGQGLVCYPWDTDLAAIPLTSGLTAAETQAHAFLLSDDRDTRAPRCYDEFYRIDTIVSEDGRARLRQPIGPHLANRSGIVQGGVIAGLLTDACLAAARSRDASLTTLLSSGCTYLRPVTLDKAFLFAGATVLLVGRRVACVSVEASDDQNTLLARGEALFATAPE